MDVSTSTQIPSSGGLCLKTDASRHTRHDTTSFLFVHQFEVVTPWIAGRSWLHLLRHIMAKLNRHPSNLFNARLRTDSVKSKFPLSDTPPSGRVASHSRDLILYLYVTIYTVPIFFVCFHHGTTTRRVISPRRSISFLILSPSSLIFQFTKDLFFISSCNCI